MSLTTGSRLGAYEILAPIGAGGMGEVYRAKDTTLDREVAIKILPDVFAHDAERVTRFAREAKTLASLNHPNIAQIYGLLEEAPAAASTNSGPGEANHVHALVMELVEGHDLAVVIARGALPLAEALPIARQIADALEAAHEQGVVHRDLKPANIKVRADGTVKVLDFGLAKALDPAGASGGGDVAHSPTMTARATQMGMIIGTAAYMAPEQAKGKSVDRRADIWAFGVVLFEMLTGRRAFQGDDVSDVLASVLKSDPDWGVVPAGLPAGVRRLLRRCLEKDPRKRLSAIGDARLDLDETEQAEASAPPVPAPPALPAPPASRRLVPWAAAALVILGAAGAIGLWVTIGPGARNAAEKPRGPVHLSLSVPLNIRVLDAAVNPDGRTLLMFGTARKPDGTEEPRPRAYTRKLDEDSFKAIPGTEGIQNVILSPDGKWLAFVAAVSEQSSQKRLAKVAVDGSAPPVALADWDDAWISLLAWLEGGDILVTLNGGASYVRLPAAGGAASPPQLMDTGPVRGNPAQGWTLPGDRGVLFSMESWGPRGYQQDLWLLDPKSGKARRLIESATNGIYLPTGHLVFSRGAVLMAAPFDLNRLALTGEVIALADGLRTANSWSSGTFSVSGDGTLVFAPGGRLGTDRRLVTVDASDRITTFGADARAFETPPRISRDGRLAAVVIANAKGTYETWTVEAGRPGVRRVLSLPNADCWSAIWSPDGQRLVYGRVARDNDDGLYVQRADGTAPSQVILKSGSPETSLRATSWAPDGTGILVTKVVGGTTDILFVPVSATGRAGTPRALRATPASEDQGKFSPDGRLVAFQSNESGKTEVYVAPIGADGSLGPAALVSNGGGGTPAWANDSRHLYYYRQPDTVMSAVITVTPGVSASASVVAYDLKKLRVNPGEWDIMPDGRLFAIQKGPGEDDITAFNVVLNWFDELRVRMPRGK